MDKGANINVLLGEANGIATPDTGYSPMSSEWASQAQEYILPIALTLLCLGFVAILAVRKMRSRSSQRDFRIKKKNAAIMASIAIVALTAISSAHYLNAKSDKADRVHATDGSLSVKVSTVELKVTRKDKNNFAYAEQSIEVATADGKYALYAYMDSADLVSQKDEKQVIKGLKSDKLVELTNNSWGIATKKPESASDKVWKGIPAGSDKAVLLAQSAEGKSKVYLGVNVGQELPADSYTGTITYMAVAQNVPEEEPEDPLLTIEFETNGGGGNMEPQKITKGGTVKLDSSTLTPPEGYYFAGWNDKKDGTGAWYDDGQEIDVDELAKAGKTLTIYAQWKKITSTCTTQIPGITYMQQLAGVDNTALLARMETDAEYFMVDARDDKQYCVAKLRDGKIWMTQNLDHDIAPDYGYDHSNTDLGYGTNTNQTWIPDKATYQTGDMTWEVSNVIQQSYDPGDIISSDGIVRCPSTSGGDKLDCVSRGTNTHYHLGNYYTWSAAVAMNDTGAYATNYQDADQSICPAGWTLPKSGKDVSKGSFQYMVEQYNWDDTSGPIPTMTDPSIWEAPLYFLIGGVWTGENLAYNDGILLGVAGFQSPVIYRQDTVYGLAVTTNNLVEPSYDIGRDFGASVRCVSR